MRVIIFTLLLVSSAACWATPVTYYFHGVTNDIQTTIGRHDALVPLVRDDGIVVTNGDSVMNGEIVFDPQAWREGAGGSGWGEVLSWKYATQGLDYWGPGSDLPFHYLGFYHNRFSYLDEVPGGGYRGPDVVSLSFNFDATPFVSGPAHFPVESFIGGSFGAVNDDMWVNDDYTVYSIQGVITKMWTRQDAVPEPSSLLLLTGGLLILVGCRRLKTVK